MRIQFLSDRKDDSLPRLLQYPGLGYIKHKTEDEHNAIFHSRLHNHIIVSLCLEQIYGITNQHGTIQVNPCQSQYQHKAERHPSRIWFHIGKQMQ